MEQDRIEIKLNKSKGLLAFLGAIAFVVISAWLITIADEQGRYDPYYLKGIAVVSIVFFGGCGVYIFFKLFDAKPGLVIDGRGICDNSSAIAGKLIKWSEIKGLEVRQVSTVKFILLHVNDPQKFIQETTGFKKRLMRLNYEMYGTPLAISCNGLDCGFEMLYEIIDGGLKKARNEVVH